MVVVNDSFHGNWMLRCALGSIDVDRPPTVLLLPEIVADVSIVSREPRRGRTSPMCRSIV
jgi:hypothetical protein